MVKLTCFGHNFKRRLMKPAITILSGNERYFGPIVDAFRKLRPCKQEWRHVPAATIGLPTTRLKSWAQPRGTRLTTGLAFACVRNPATPPRAH
jgi:hypothetical protein